MQFIPESTIDQMVLAMESLENHESFIEELGQSQPAILAYLTSDNFKFFTPTERDFALFLTFVIWKSVQQHHPELPAVSEEMISQKEDSNWELFDQQKSKLFKEKLNPFFNNYEQEDLLAFVEDALEPDEE